MKPMMIYPAVLVSAVVLFTGCGQSSSNSNQGSPNASSPAPASKPEAAVPAPPAAPSPAPALASTDAQAAPAKTAAAAVDTSASSVQATNQDVSQFAAAAASQPDQTAASIGSDLAAKANSLAQSTDASPELKNQVGSAMQSLSAGKDANALTTLFQQAKQANLTPQQSQMVKDVGHLASAYVVQRNFSSLNGAQGDVATLVGSLRKGSVAPALPALKSLAQNASLTAQQKDLVATLADQYAPGLKTATDSLKQRLQGIPGLGK
jgi:hypothetical protein